LAEALALKDLTILSLDLIGRVARLRSNPAKAGAPLGTAGDSTPIWV
jgi:hypothetical protein